jgi:hypothetical protein
MILPCADGSQIFFSSSHRDLLEKGVLRVGDHGERVVGDRQFVVLDARGAALIHLLLQDRPRRVGDVDLAAAELLEAAAGARDADRDPHRAAYCLLEILSDASVTGKTVEEPSIFTTC